MKAIAACGLLVVAILSASCGADAQPGERLEEIYSPTFAQIPPPEPVSVSLRKLAEDWRGAPGAAFRRDLVSIQGAAAAGALILLLIVAFDFRSPGSPRNLDLLLLYAAGACLFNAIRFFEVLGSPTYLNLLDWVFSAVVAISLTLLVRALLRVRRPLTRPWTPNLRTGPLALLAAALLAVNVGLAVARPPDDAGWFVNLGAQRLRERGRLPYGDPLLTGTPAAAYGPVLYVAHVPFQILLSPRPVNPATPDKPRLGPESRYYLPARLATQLATVAFHLAGLVALFVIGRRRSSIRAGLALVCLYAGSLAVLGIGGHEYTVAGITFVSHIAPAAMTLLALAALPLPAVSGGLLAIAAGAGFYPAFMAPAWLGYFWNDKAARLRFLLGSGIVAAIIAAGVYTASRPAGGQTRVATILHDTFGHHTDPAGYGRSPFGFWGQRQGVRRVLMTPLIGRSDLTTPAWLLFFLLICASFFLARRRSSTDLALLAGAIAIGAALVKPHATGTYLAWYYPLLLIGFLMSPAGAERPPAIARSDVNSARDNPVLQERQQQRASNRR